MYAWTDDTFNGGGRLSGSALFTGTSPTGTVAVTSAYTNYAVATDDLQLTAGQQYVAFLTTAGQGGSDADSEWAIPSAGGDAYTGGKFVLDSGQTIGQLESRLWAEVTPTADLAFQFTFVPVPEPTAVLGVAAAGLGLAARWRRGRAVAGA